MANPFEKAALSLGFEHETTGGGCVALTRYFPKGDSVMVTGEEGTGLPSPQEGFCVGYYPPNWDGEEIELARGKALPDMAQAIADALAKAGATVPLADSLIAQGWQKFANGGGTHVLRKGRLVLSGADGDLPDSGWFMLALYRDWDSDLDSLVWSATDASAEGWHDMGGPLNLGETIAEGEAQEIALAMAEGREIGAQSLDALTRAFAIYTGAEKLPDLSCEELLHETLSAEQRAALSAFLIAWESAESRADCERNGHRDTGRGVCANCGDFL